MNETLRSCALGLVAALVVTALALVFMVGIWSFGGRCLEFAVGPGI